MASGIYKIINPIGAVYIGKSLDLDRRLREYKNINCKLQSKLYASILEYGWNNHQFIILEECEENHINHLERYYQELYNCVKSGLNCVYTSTKSKSGRLGEETKLKMSIAKKGKKDSEITKLKKSESAKIFQNLESTKKIKSESLKKVQKEVQNRPEVKLKKSESGKIAQNKIETKIKKSLALKGKVSTCPHCFKIGGIANMTRYHFNNCKALKK